MARSSKSSNTDYIYNGVSINPPTPAVGDSVKVSYDGLLAKSGASHVYAYVGFGNRWENDHYIQMNRSTTGFEASIPVSNSDILNVCFKDCANNWDNNSGKNYSFDITQ